MKHLLLLIFLACPVGLLAQEICDNGIDDDGDGQIDRNDTVDCRCLGIIQSSLPPLLPNPSFEDTLCCPSLYSQLHCAEGWIQASDATTDYLNFCGYIGMVISQPFFPLPRGGTGYVGFYDFYMPSTHSPVYQEYLGTCLSVTIPAQQDYQMRFFLARGEGNDTIIVSLYGTPDCNDLPWDGEGCPVGSGSWIELGRDTVALDSNAWKQVDMPFTAPVTISAVAIGGACDNTTFGVIGATSTNYYYIDELTLAEGAAFNRDTIIVAESGKWCTNDLQLTANIHIPGGSWQWYRSGIALSGETGDTLNLMPYGTGVEYTAVYTLDGDCVSVAHSVEAVFSGDQMPQLRVIAACKGFSNGRAYLALDTTDTLAFSYQWRSLEDTTVLSETDTLNNAPAGRYSLQITQGSHCDTMLYFDIPEEDFRVSFLPADTLICTMDTLQFVNTSDTHFTAYYWTFGNGDTFSGATPPPYIFPEGGVYPVRLTGTGLICTDTAYGTIRVDPPIHPGFELEPSEVCLGKPVALYPRIDSTIRYLEWQFSGQRLTEQRLQSRFQYAFDTPGVQVIRLSYHPRVCPDTSYTDSITVYPLPEVDLGGDSSICLHGQPVYLKNLRDAPLMPYHQVWSTGDTTEVLKVVHPGFYTLRVTTEPIGCSTTESIQITKNCYMDIPNAFTPNGDGSNDYFLPRPLLTEGVTRFRMQVFNRWGQLLFETNRLDGSGWDGRFNDRAQPTGVYLYRIEVHFSNHRQEQYEGNVTLIR